MSKRFIILSSLLLVATTVGGGCANKNTITNSANGNATTTNTKSTNAAVQEAQEALDEFNSASASVTDGLSQDVTEVSTAVDDLAKQ
ncbi:MAG: hypothetical protein WCW27_00075 [Patescibacteria group bacterium]|jgi:hypothetical protein